MACHCWCAMTLSAFQARSASGRSRSATPGSDALLLGPLAVHPDRQNIGIGLALMREGIARAKAIGRRLILLVGDAALLCAGRISGSSGRPAHAAWAGRSGEVSLSRNGGRRFIASFRSGAAAPSLRRKPAVREYRAGPAGNNAGRGNAVTAYARDALASFAAPHRTDGCEKQSEACERREERNLSQGADAVDVVFLEAEPAGTGHLAAGRHFENAR